MVLIAERARALSEELARRIEERFWLEGEGLYADVIASPRMLLERIEHLRGQRGNEAPPMREALDRVEAECRRLDPDVERPWLFKNWVIFCPLEAGRDLAVRCLRDIVWRMTEVVLATLVK